MSNFEQVKNKFNLTLWKSNIYKDKIFRIKLATFPLYNNDFPVRGFGEALTPGYYYFPDSTYFDIRISTDGIIHIPLKQSVSFEDNTIIWSDGEIWNKVIDIPKNNQVNYLDFNVSISTAIDDTKKLYEKMNSIYGQHATVPGQKLPNWY
jgi:hypothetical protein